MIRDTLEGEFGVLVIGASVVLFDVLDTCASLLLAVLVFGGCLCLGVRFSAGSTGPEERSQVDQALLQLQRAFPECLCEGKVDLAAMTAKLGVSHNYLCVVVFEHGLTATVGEVQAAARLWASVYDSVATEDVAQAAAAPDKLRARSGQEEKMQKKRNGAPPHKKEIRMRCS